MTPRRPPLRYHGSKWRDAPKIIDRMPPHRIYCESFGGGAAVLFRKPRSWAEVYNDIDGAVVNYFQVLRNHRDKLLYALRHTPFARGELELSYEETDDPVELARRTVVRSFMGHSSASTTKTHKTGFRANSFGSNGPAAKDWRNLPDALEAAAERLMGVVIENRDAVEVMRNCDRPDTLHYIDPPYPLETRHTGARWRGACYANELTDDDHRELERVVMGLEGMAMVSGYACELYDGLYEGWERVEYQTTASGANGAVKRTEVLWLSPRCAEAQRQPSLFAVHSDP
jgi:DNA adenine methylase